jgi:antirestriction protein ArdC
MSDIYLDVTQKIVTALDQGVIPWIKPWSPAHHGALQPFPVNAVTGRAYSGINIPLLWAEARLKGYTQDRWLTFNQARKAGGHIRKDEHATLAVLYKPMSREQQDDTGQPLLDEQGNAKQVQFAILRTHCLFNIEQTEGVENLDVEVIVPDEGAPFANHDLAEQLLIDSGARIDHRPGDEAFYQTIADRIQLPTKPQFNTEGDYYATALHELTHWTGHHLRLKREGIIGQHRFGTSEYAFEELVAEMGAAFLCALTGIQGELRHEGYIASWLKLLKDDKRAIFRASGHARDAADFLLELQHRKQEDLPQSA